MVVECEVCYEAFQPSTTGSLAPILLPTCGHTFCKECTGRIKAEKGSMLCPYCKKPSNEQPNYSLIDLITKGYLTCISCHYKLKTNIKECQFNSKGDYCFDCSKDIKGGLLTNFSLVDAM